MSTKIRDTLNRLAKDYGVDTTKMGQSSSAPISNGLASGLTALTEEYKASKNSTQNSTQTTTQNTTTNNKGIKTTNGVKTIASNVTIPEEIIQKANAGGQTISASTTGRDKSYVPVLQKIFNPSSYDGISMLSTKDKEKIAEIEQKKTDLAIEKARLEAEESTIAGITRNVYGGMVGGFTSAVGTAVDKLQGNPMDVNASYNRLNYQANSAQQALQEKAANTIGAEEGTFKRQLSDMAVGSGLSALQTIARLPLAEAAIPSKLGNMKTFLGKSINKMTTFSLSSLQAGVSAGTNAMLEAKKKGATDKQAIASGLWKGFNEGLWEAFSMGTLLEDKSAKNIREAILLALGQMGAEGLEEFNTDIANEIADRIVMGEKSDFNTAKNKYMEMGMTKDDAETKANLDVLAQAFWSFAGGALSGGVLGGLKVGVDTVGAKLGDGSIKDHNIQFASLVNEYINGNADAYEGNPEKYNLLTKSDLINAQNQALYEVSEQQKVEERAKTIAEAEQTTENTTPVEKAKSEAKPLKTAEQTVENKQTHRDMLNNVVTEIVDNGATEDSISNVLDRDEFDNLTANDREYIVNRVEAEQQIRKAVDDYNNGRTKSLNENYDVSILAEASKRVGENDMNVDSNENTFKYEAQAFEPNGDATQKTIDNALKYGTVNVYANEEIKDGTPVTLSREEALKNGPVFTKTIGIDDAVWNDSLRGGVYGSDKSKVAYDKTPKASKVVDTESRDGVSGKLITAEEIAKKAKEKKDGRKNLSDKGNGRNLSLRKGERDGSVQGRSENSEDSRGRENRKTRSNENTEESAEKVIPNAKSGQKVTVLSEFKYNDEQKEATKSASDSGVSNVVLFNSDKSVELKNGEKARAFFDGVTDTIGVMANNTRASVTNLIRHELTERAIYNGKLDTEEVRVQMLSELTEEEIESIITPYLPKNFKNLTEDEQLKAVDHAFKELVCDSFGGINQFKGSRNYGDLADTMNKAIESVSEMAEEVFSMRYETKNNDTEYSTENEETNKDSKGNKLTKSQTEYFKDSKVRDENGNLLVMYHGTDTYNDFYIFKSGKSGNLGPAIYFTDNNSYATRYATKDGYEGRVYETYLNVKNPFVVKSDTPAREILGEKVSAKREQKNSYPTKWITKADINKLKTKGYDGIIWKYGSSPIEVAVFDSNQIKNINNTNPTSDPDIRYSTELDEKYMSAVKYGDMKTAQKMVDEAAKENGYTRKIFHGTGNKKFNIFKQNINGTYTSSDIEVAGTYGDRVISLYGKKGNNVLTIDAKNSPFFAIPKEYIQLDFSEYPLLRELETYRTDDITKIANKEGYDVVVIENVYDKSTSISNTKSDGIATDVIYFNSSSLKSADTVTYDEKGNIIPLSKRFNDKNYDIRYSTEIEDKKDLLAIHNITADKLMSALGRGNIIMPSLAITNKKFGDFGDISLIFKEDTIDPSKDAQNKLYGSDAWTPTQNNLKKNAQFDKEKVANTVATINENLGKHSNELFDVSADEFENTVKKNGGSIYNAYANNIGMQTAYCIENKLIDSIPTNKDGSVNEAELANAVDEKLDNDKTWRDYKAWMENLSNDIITSHDNATTSDIYNDMKSQPDTAKRFKLSLNGELTAPVTKYDSVDTARSNKSRLKDDVSVETKTVANNLLSWADKVASKTMVSKKSVVNAINESFDNRYDTNAIKESFAEKGIAIDEKLAKELQNLYKDAVELPTQYFEAKPSRVVPLDEIDTAVVPDNASEDLITALEEKGINVVTYKAGDEESRTNAVRSREELMFSTEIDEESKEDIIKQAKKEERERLKEIENKRKEKREYTKGVNELLKEAKRISKLRGTQEFEEEVRSYIGNLSLERPSLTENRIATLKDLANEIKAWCEKDANYAELDGRKDVEKVEDLSKVHARDLTYENLVALTKAMKALETAKRNYDREVATEHRRYMSDMARVFIKQQDEVGGIINKDGIKNKFGNYLLNMLNPTRAMRMLDGYDKNGIMTHFGNMLNDGQTKVANFKMNVEKAFQEIDNNKELLKDFSKQNIPIRTMEGTFNISKGMQMSLYFHSLNADNLEHIAKGGIIIPNASFYKAGNFKDAYGRGDKVHLANPNAKDAMTQTRARIKEITASMSPEQKKYCEVAYKFFNETSKDAINEVSRVLKGYDIADVENYFPIRVADDFKNKDFTNILEGTPSIESSGFLKERLKGAKAPIALEDVSNVVLRQKNGTAMYYGLAIPVRNFNTFYKYTARGYKTSVQDTLDKTWGSAGKEYVQKLLEDIQGGKGRQTDVLDWLKSKYAGGVLSYNLGVAIKQSASYPFAATVIGSKPLLKAAKNVFSKADYDYMDSITPWGYMRRQGFSGTEMGEVAKQRNSIESNQTFQKFKTLTDLIRRVDVKTTDTLFFATEEWVKENHPELEVRGEKYSKILADKYNEVLQRTQPSYDVMQRNAFLRQNTAATKVLGMFKTQTFNMGGELIDAIEEYKVISERAKKDSSYEAQAKEAKQHLKATYASTIASQTMLGVLSALASAVTHRMKRYRDENEEITWESILKMIGIDTLSSFAGLVYGGSEVQKVASAIYNAGVKGEKYDDFSDLSYPGLDLVNDMVSSSVDLVAELNKAISSGSFEKMPKHLSKATINTARFFGIPADNFYNIVNAGYLWYKDIKNGEVGTFNAGRGMFGLKDTSVSQKGYAQQMLKQFANGSTEGAAERLRRASNAGYDEEKVMNTARDVLKEDEELAMNVYENGNDTAKKLSTHAMYLANKPKNEDGESVTKEQKLDTINQLDISDESKGEEYAKLFDSKALNKWVEDGGSKYDYLQGQEIAVDLDNADTDTKYTFVYNGNYTDEQKVAWLHSNYDTITGTKYTEWDGTDIDFIKHMAVFESYADDKSTKENEKQNQVILYIKSQPRSMWKSLWKLAGYSESTYEEKVEGVTKSTTKSTATSSSTSAKKLAAPKLKTSLNSKLEVKTLKKY